MCANAPTVLYTNLSHSVRNSGSDYFSDESIQVHRMSDTCSAICLLKPSELMLSDYKLVYKNVMGVMYSGRNSETISVNDLHL